MKQQLDKSKLTELQLLFLEGVKRWLDTVTGVTWQMEILFHDMVELV